MFLRLTLPNASFNDVPRIPAVDQLRFGVFRHFVRGNLLDLFRVKTTDARTSGVALDHQNLTILVFHAAYLSLLYLTKDISVGIDLLESVNSYWNFFI